MKIILLATDYNIGANIAVKKFLEQPLLKKHSIRIEGIVVADQFNLKSRHLKRTFNYFRKIKLIFLLKNILTNIWKQIKMFLGRHLIKREEREYYSLKELAEEHKIDFKQVSSINDEEARNFIQQKNPDLLVSCFLLEIVKKPLLNLPKLGSINIHPGLVQQHRGTFSAFWTLLNKWKKSGVTLHYMTEKVDEGEVILQKKFFISASDTVHSINKKAAQLGGKLLAKAIVKIKKKKGRFYRLKKLGRLFSSPSSVDIDRFYQQKRRIISIEELFRF